MSVLPARLPPQTYKVLIYDISDEVVLLWLVSVVAFVVSDTIIIRCCANCCLSVYHHFHFAFLFSHQVRLVSFSQAKKKSPDRLCHICGLAI